MKKSFRFGAVALAVSATSSAWAQQIVTQPQTAYNSLTAPFNNPSLVTTAGDQKYINARTTESGGVGVYFVANTFENNNSSATNIGGNTLSTTLLADDLTLQVAALDTPGSYLSSYNINTLGFLLGNRNATDVTLNAHVRIYDVDGFGDTIILGTNNNGGYAGTLLKSYDLGAVTLASNVDASAGQHYASITRLDVPSATFSSSPLTFEGSQFDLVGNNYQRRIWVGLFLTADATTTTAAQLNNIGYVAYDPDTTNNGAGGASSETFERGSSSDQLYGDRNLDFNTDGDYNDTYTQTRPDGVSVVTSENAALANGGYNFPRINPDTPNGPGADVQADRIRNLSILSQGGNFPQANLTWLIQGDATYVVTPEPGTVGLALAGAFPFGVAIVRRRRVRRTAK